MDNKKQQTNNKNGMGSKKADIITKAVGNKTEEITDWFYMTPNEITAKMIADKMKVQNDIEVDLWEEMNILQLVLSNKTTVDFEPVIINFKDPSDAAFVKNRNIKTIFEVTMELEAFPIMKPFLKLIVQEWEGFLCADSDDFKPIYGKEELE